MWGQTDTHAPSVWGLTTACACSPQALEKYNIEKDIASYIKKEVRCLVLCLVSWCLAPLLTHPMRAAPLQFDKKFGPTWHCIVGRNFGSFVTHETKHFLYMYLGQVAVLLFKSG